jgi:hypothetical protein
MEEDKKCIELQIWQYLSVRLHRWQDWAPHRFRMQRHSHFYRVLTIQVKMPSGLDKDWVKALGILGLYRGF